MPQRRKIDRGRPARLILLGVVALGLLINVLLHGHDIALVDPKGLMAGEQLKLMLFSAGLLLVVAVPTVTLLYFTAWKYRETNAKATYDPHTRHGKSLVFTMWAIPSVFMLVLALVMWPATHRLEPQKLIAADAKPLTVEVVALRWKWLFIYPELHIATVNFVQIPTGTPVEFELTADDAPMSSFWIPHLGGQLYAMTGHVNRLNLLAETPGDYAGSSAEINGAGFADMKFTARASSKQDFDSWAQDTRLTSDALDSTEYERLLKPSESNPIALYSLADTSLYDTVLMKYMGSHDMHMGHE
jgi:cytochrome o ubiquinol oxidase subunit 2